MTDLTTMMRDQARAGLRALLDVAVTDGNTEAAQKVAADIAKLEISAAPKAPPFGDIEIRAQLDKQTWFGTDPKRSAKAVEFGKTMDPKKFATAEAFAAAIIKAVDEEFKPVGAAPIEEEEEEEEEVPPVTAKPRRTDAPGEGDANQRATARRATSGPWVKITDAPADVQKEINRQASKFVSAHATKEQRASFVTKALESHFAEHQRKAGKK